MRRTTKRSSLVQRALSERQSSREGCDHFFIRSALDRFSRNNGDVLPIAEINVCVCFFFLGENLVEKERERKKKRERGREREREIDRERETLVEETLDSAERRSHPPQCKLHARPGNPCFDSVKNIRISVYSRPGLPTEWHALITTLPYRVGVLCVLCVNRTTMSPQTKPNLEEVCSRVRTARFYALPSP